MVRSLMSLYPDIDVRHVLPSVSVPTLVVHRRGDRMIRVDAGRYLAEHIPGAKLVELDGDDHLFFTGDTDAILDEIEEFLTGVRPRARARARARPRCSSPTSSTRPRAPSSWATGKWRQLLEAHTGSGRAAQLDRFRGLEVNTTGDGFLATFDGPARAIRCASAIVDEAAANAIEVRAGLHTGEVELMDGDIGGVAVHIAARVAGLAQSGEVLVSSTVKDLVAGSGLTFADRGEQVLKGVPDSWRLLRGVPVTFEPIGVVVGGRRDAIDDHWGDVDTSIVLDADRFPADTLAGLDAFSHLEVVFHFHLVAPDDVTTVARHPRGRTDWPKVGIFAQRAKGRPNRIGVSTCQIRGVDGHTVRVRGLDAIDGTPVLDLKPYMLEFAPRGEVREPEWAAELMREYW